MATLNRAAVVTGYINAVVVALTPLQLTDTEEYAHITLKFKTTGTPSGSESFLIDIIQNVYSPNPPPETPLRISLAFVGGKWVCSYPTGDGAFNPFYSADIVVPPNSYIQITDISGGKMSIGVLGTKFRNFSN